MHCFSLQTKFHTCVTDSSKAQALRVGLCTLHQREGPESQRKSRMQKKKKKNAEDAGMSDIRAIGLNYYCYMCDRDVMH